MIRKIIKIDEELCNGCGLCANACHEGAIGMVNGKAKLLRDDFCDGLGACLPVCPTGAITFEEREAAEFDEKAVNDSKAEKTEERPPVPPLPCGCPGTKSRFIKRVTEERQPEREPSSAPVSRLSQWPVQIKLVPVNAPYFNGARLLIAADCAAYAYADFHNKFIKNHITLIGCPKLDMTDYAVKLTEILKHNDIKSVRVVRMEVPCCGGIEYAVRDAVKASGKTIPWQVVTVSTDGQILDE